jgi:hypothetical protein
MFASDEEIFLEEFEALFRHSMCGFCFRARLAPDLNTHLTFSSSRLI